MIFLKAFKRYSLRGIFVCRILGKQGNYKVSLLRKKSFFCCETPSTFRTVLHF